MFIVGINIAKHTQQASVMNADGSLVGKSIRIPNSSVEFNTFISKLIEIERDITTLSEFFTYVRPRMILGIMLLLPMLSAFADIVKPLYLIIKSHSARSDKSLIVLPLQYEGIHFKPYFSILITLIFKFPI